MFSNSTLRIIGISLSLSCLYFIVAFRKLLYPSGHWYGEPEVSRLEFLSTFCISLLVFSFFGILLVLLSYQREGRSKTELQILFVAFALIAFGPLSSEILTWALSTPNALFKYVLPAIVLLLCFFSPGKGKNRKTRLVNNLGTVALVFLPVSLLIVGRGVLVMTGVENQGFASNSFGINQEIDRSNESLKRVVWIIFDELDYSAISNRPSRIQMPTFDALMERSFVGENTFAPHIATLVSTPALLAGTRVRSTTPHGPDKLKLNLYSNDASVELTEIETIFDDVLSLQGTSGVVGWYHPYPRLFREKVRYGHWTPISTIRCNTFVRCVFHALATSFEDLPLLRDLSLVNIFDTQGPEPFKRNEERLDRDVHSQFNLSLREHAKRLVANDGIDFAFLHFSIPHGPFVTLAGQTEGGYLDSLEVVDETLAILRDEMRVKNIWERTTLIVSSDHWLRTRPDAHYGEAWKPSFSVDETRVPFIVKMAGDEKPLRYSRRFNSVISRYLIKSIISGDVTTVEQVAEWIDQTALERPELVNFHPCWEEHSSAPIDLSKLSGAKLACR